VRIDCDVQDALLFLIVVISMRHDFFSFDVVVSKREEWKEKAFLWSVPGDINIATPLQWRLIDCGFYFLSQAQCGFLERDSANKKPQSTESHN